MIIRENGNSSFSEHRVNQNTFSKKRKREKKEIIKTRRGVSAARGENIF